MSRSKAASHSVVDAIPRYAFAIGATLVLLLPAARGHHAALGWLPMWLLAMPLSAWGALRLARVLERVPPVCVETFVASRRRPAVQARRRPRTTTGPVRRPRAPVLPGARQRA